MGYEFHDPIYALRIESMIGFAPQESNSSGFIYKFVDRSKIVIFGIRIKEAIK